MEVYSKAPNSNKKLSDVHARNFLRPQVPHTPGKETKLAWSSGALKQALNEEDAIIHFSVPGTADTLAVAVGKREDGQNMVVAWVVKIISVNGKAMLYLLAYDPHRDNIHGRKLVVADFSIVENKGEDPDDFYNFVAEQAHQMAEDYVRSMMA